jgi:hypothetical protein
MGTPEWEKKPILMMEDDAVLVDGFADKARDFIRKVEAFDPEWQGMFLGGQHMDTPNKVAEGIIRCGRVGRTHCYAARGEFLRALYRAWVFAPIHIDWVQEFVVPLYRVYAPERFLVDQGDGVSFISGRENPRMTWNHADPKCVIVLRAPKSVMDKLRPQGWHSGFSRNETTGIDDGLTALLRMSDPVVLFAKLKELLAVYSQEVANMKDGLPVVWHPEIPVEWVRMCSKIPVFEIRNATTPEQCKEAFAIWKSHAAKEG